MKAAGKLPPTNWLKDSDTIRLMSSLMSGGKPARFVGGCVRDTLINREFSDIDIATEEPAENVLKLLKQARIALKPIGIEHGSVLALINKRAYNITSLRKDEDTDGRYAKVSYTDDWLEDAKRRDFTINALYADLDGTYYDPCNGLIDLSQGLIRFIGEANQRISEDYLRILRYFRFQAHYGKQKSTQSDLQVCQTHAPKLKSISKERIWSELHRLLEAQDVFEVLENMRQYEIFDQIFTHKINLNGLKILSEIEVRYEIKHSPLRRLALISLEDISHLREDLKLSTKEINHIYRLRKLVISQPNLHDKLTCDTILYTEGSLLFLDLILLLQDNFEENFKSYQNWNHPTLPISGQDLMEIGINKGPEIGRILKSVTNWWIEQSFRPGTQECLNWVKRNKL